MASTKKKPGKTPAEHAAEAKALSDRYTEFRDSLDEDEIAAYAARFDHYSERNALLIVMQDPDATVVHGFVDWKKYGRKVKGDGSAKGKGIYILAFAGEDPRSTDTAGTKPAGRMFFRKACVFDIRHTEPVDQADTDLAVAELVAS